MIESINRRYFMIAIGSAALGKSSDLDIAVRCPKCSADERWKHTTRLHLYHSNGKDYVNCFTGDCELNSPRGVYSFLKDFYPSLLGSYKKEKFLNNIQNLTKSGDVFSNIIDNSPSSVTANETTEADIKADILDDWADEEVAQLDNHINKDNQEDNNEVKTYDLTSFFKPISEVPECIQYINNRGIEYNQEKYGKWYFGITDLSIDDIKYNINNSIIIPLYYNDEMYGFYSRSIYKKDFYTYMSSVNVGYKVWNWFNVDKSKKVYIFEAIFDAIASGLPNVIALMGAKIPKDRLNELKEPVFVLDNDKAGIKNSIEYAGLGHQVYIQPNDILYKDMNDILINTDINIEKMVKENIYSGISAQVRLKMKL